MTRDEIIKMATQAGWQMPAEWDSSDGFSRRLERFAHAAYAAGAAAERERIIAANAPEIERINAYIKEKENNA